MISKKKGQASIEMFTTVGIMIAFIVPLAVLLLTFSSQGFEEVSKSQADITVKKIAHSMNTVYLEGDGATKTILVNLPSNSDSLNITGFADGGEVRVNLTGSFGSSEATYPFIANLKEDFHTPKKGLFWLKITNMNHEVNISE